MIKIKFQVIKKLNNLNKKVNLHLLLNQRSINCNFFLTLLN